MRASSDLGKLYDAIQYRLIRIERLFASAPRRPPQDRTVAIGTAVIELDNLIVCGLREFTISTCFRARTLNKTRIKVARRFTTEGEISAYLLSMMNVRSFENKLRPDTLPRREEPTVRQPRDVERILAGQAASNIASVNRAVALNASVFDDLPTLRNFYAHRNEDTWRKAYSKSRNLGLFAVAKADDIATGFAPGRSSTVFDDWMGETRIFFEELMR